VRREVSYAADRIDLAIEAIEKDEREYAELLKAGEA
jgi:hypothetical protein